MISVCIPVYNYDIGDLIKSLRTQAQQVVPLVEILVIDDGSAPDYREINRKYRQFADRFIELPGNTGRAAIRNSFTEYAQFDHLLILDCDVLPASDRFLEEYLRSTDADIVNGGREYAAEVPSREYILRWKYGNKVESRTAGQRKRHPYRSFQTSNFMVRKSVLQQFPFEDSIKSYGHEDTLFGYHLMKAGVKILHIDNPVINVHLENNETYLKHTEEALKNLADLSALRGFETYVFLSRFYRKLEKRKMLWILRVFPRRLVRKILEKGYGPVAFFQLYKLIYYAHLKRRKTA